MYHIGNIGSFYPNYSNRVVHYNHGNRGYDDYGNHVHGDYGNGFANYIFGNTTDFYDTYDRSPQFENNGLLTGHEQDTYLRSNHNLGHLDISGGSSTISSLSSPSTGFLTPREGPPINSGHSQAEQQRFCADVSARLSKHSIVAKNKSNLPGQQSIECNDRTQVPECETPKANYANRTNPFSLEERIATLNADIEIADKMLKNGEKPILPVIQHYTSRR